MPHQVHNKHQRVMYLEVYLPTAQVSYQMHLQISLALQAIHQVPSSDNPSTGEPSNNNAPSSSDGSSPSGSGTGTTSGDTPSDSGTGGNSPSSP